MIPLLAVLATTRAGNTCGLNLQDASDLYINWATAMDWKIGCMKDILGANEPVAPWSALAPTVKFDWPPWYYPLSEQYEIVTKYARLYELSMGGYGGGDKNQTLTFESVDGMRKYMIRQFDFLRTDLITGGLFAMKIEESWFVWYYFSLQNTNLFVELALSWLGWWNTEDYFITKTSVAIPNVQAQRKVRSIRFDPSIYSLSEEVSFKRAARQFEKTILTLPETSHQFIHNGVVHAELYQADYFLVHEVIQPTVGISVLFVMDLAKNSSSIYIDIAANFSELRESMYR